MYPVCDGLTELRQPIRLLTLLKTQRGALEYLFFAVFVPFTDGLTLTLCITSNLLL